MNGYFPVDLSFLPLTLSDENVGKSDKGILPAEVLPIIQLSVPKQ